MAVEVHAWAVLAGLALGSSLAAVAVVGGGMEVIHWVDGDVLVVGLSAVVTGRTTVVVTTGAGTGGGVVTLGVDGGSGWLTDGEGAEAGGVEEDEREAEDSQFCNIRGAGLHVQPQEGDDTGEEHEDEEGDHGEVEDGDLDESCAGGLGDSDALEGLEEGDGVVENKTGLEEDNRGGGIGEATLANDTDDRDRGDQPSNAVHEGGQNGDEDGDVGVVRESLVGLLTLDSVDQLTPHGHLEPQGDEWEQQRDVVDGISPRNRNFIRRKGNRQRQIKASGDEDHIPPEMLTILLDSLDNKHQHPDSICEHNPRQDIQSANQNIKPNRPPHMVPRPLVLLNSRQEGVSIGREEGSHGDNRVGPGVGDVEVDFVVPVMGVGQLGEGGSEIFHAGGVAVHDHGADLRECEELELGVDGW